MNKKAYIRYSKEGKLAPNSMTMKAGAPPSGGSAIWVEIPSDLCCGAPTPGGSGCCEPTLYTNGEPVSGTTPFVSMRRQNTEELGLVDTTCRSANNPVKLTNGTIVNLDWILAVLGNGIVLYQAYEIACDPFPGYINGWFVAMKPNATDPTQYDIIGELKMTQQFWDWWYDYTYHPTTDSVQFITYESPYGLGSNATSYITTVTVASNGTITAVDESHTYGDTWNNLWFNLTNQSGDPIIWSAVIYPTYNSLDDWYGMLDGPDKGWIYLFNNINLDIYGFQVFVGFNLFTGATRYIDTAVAYAAAGVTNYPTIASGTLIVSRDVYSHPQGLLLQLGNKDCMDPLGYIDFTDYKCATGLWSPYWTDVTKAKVIDARYVYQPYNFIAQNGDAPRPESYYGSATSRWDFADSSLYIFGIDTWDQQAAIGVYYRLPLNSDEPSETKDLLIPEIPYGQIDYVWDFPTDKGMFMLPRIPDYFYYNPFETVGLCAWLKVDEKPEVLKTIGMYPVSFQGSSIYDPYYGVANGLMVGLTIDTFTNKTLQ